MKTFNLEEEMVEVLDSCGGEDLLRWLLKDDGIDNWETIELYPIIAYSPSHLDRPIVIGITHMMGDNYRIIHMEYDYSKYPAFERYLNYLLTMGDYEDPIEALLDHKRAILVDDEDINDANLIGWDLVLEQVIDGARDNKEDRVVDFDFYDNLIEQIIHKDSDLFMNFVSSLDELIMKIMNIDNSKSNIIQVNDADEFDDSFKEDWA